MYKIQKINDDTIWNNFIDQSPNGNIYFKSFFLDSLKDKVSKNFIIKGNQIKAGFVLVHDKDLNIIDNENIIYSGIIFNKYEDKSTSSYNLDTFSITEFFVQHLVANFKNIQFNTVPDFLDVRPFLWHNYNKKKNVFKCYPKYTSFIDINNCSDEINDPKNLFNKMNTLRRRLIRKGIQNLTKFKTTTDISYLVKSYENYMIKQQSPVSSQKINEMKKLFKNLLDNKKLLIKIAYTKEGDAGYLCIFAYDLKVGYFLYGCPLVDKVENYLGSITFWQVFKDLKKKGIDLVDMEGINSPNRGWFKQSFGGVIKQYFEIKLKN
tara:strand:+ start:209 stop:1171 length:963 start_codon:yes stop_codon:yes gene_type:complete